MFTTLVESRAVRRRSTRGIATSIALHTLLIAGAVALTHPTRGEALPPDLPPDAPIYVPAPPVAQHNIPRTADRSPRVPSPDVSIRSIPIPVITPKTLPPIVFDGPELPPDRVVLGGGITPPSIGRGETTAPFAPGAVLEAEVVDRVPRIIGNAPAPRYPDMLRQSGAMGQVVVRFVVDTLGRAELRDLVVVEATHPLFASAVKTALMGYRFTPGEAAGRKVRTLVQVPFSFTLK